MTSAETKTERLYELEQLLLSHPGGLKRNEISQRLGVNKSTVSRYVAELSLRAPVYEDECRLLHINTDRYLNRVSLTLHEIMALYLAAGFMTDGLDRKNVHAAAALRKLGLVLSRFTPPICSRISSAADLLDGPEQVEDEFFIIVLETLTRAWTYGKKIRITHFSSRRDKISEYIFSPYVILPYAAGRTLHAVGLCDGEESPRVFRVDRMRSAEILNDSYVIPSDFDPSDFFKHAWGIWRKTGEPSKVTIRFSASVSPRLRETRWHRTQSLEELPDGSTLWHAVIEEPKEMLPWIRGWGSDAEVIDPPELREMLMKEAEKLLKLYWKNYTCE